jgi:hypothetical protein
MNTEKLKSVGVPVALVFLIGMVAGLLMAEPSIQALKAQVEKDTAVTMSGTQTLNKIGEALTACSRARIEGSQGSTVLLDMTNTRNVNLTQPTEHSLRFGQLRISLPDADPQTNAPLWDVPGRVTPRVLNNAPGAVWGYMDKDGKFSGWQAPEKEQ